MSSKITNDKYYTPRELSQRLIQTTFDKIGLENISEVVEPSAGNGVFSSQIKGCIAYDIESDGEGIIEQDFLKLETPYKNGRLIIGNPPFGSRMNMAQKFFKKGVEIADYIAFILPISQLNNNRTMYEFNLIYSEDLGEVYFTDRELHVCFNIYARPKLGLNKQPKNRLKDVTIIRQDSKKYKDSPYDIKMCYWGDGAAGKILKEHESYAGEYKIIINNDERYDQIYDFITTFNWSGHFKNIAMKIIKQWQIIKILEDNIEGIK